MGAFNSNFKGITFSGENVLGAGLLVMVAFTGIPTTANPPEFVITYERR